MNSRHYSLMSHVCCLLLGTLFLFAGLAKVLYPMDFADAIAGYRLLPQPFILLAAYTLPLLEILLGFAVLWPMTRQSALLGLALLSALFILATGSALARGLNIECGCLGSTFSSIPHALGRACVLLGVSTALYAWQIQRHTNPKEQP